MSTCIRFALAGLLATACHNDDAYGVVEVQLQGPAAVFAGTESISAKIGYLECISAYYDSHPGETQDGGASVFEEWKGMLCDGAADMPIDCDVVSIEQGTTGLTIELDVRGELAGRRLAVGPLPTNETAGCAGGTRAEVRIASNSDVMGSGGGSSLWHAESFSSTTAVVGQGAPIIVEVAAN